MPAKDKIILALDMKDPAYALDIVDKFKDKINTFKVGLELFTACGPSIVRDIRSRGKMVFLDLKFHDIPNTVAQAAISAADLGVQMFNIHSSCGVEAMATCASRVVEHCLKKNINRPKILGVTVLTSISQEMLHNELGLQHSLRSQVKHLASLAQKSGLDGVVASAHEARMIRQNCGEKFIIVTPGIRPSWTPPDDQQRTMTPKQAICEGADYLVMGRAILRQPDPLNALELISLEVLTAVS